MKIVFSSIIFCSVLGLLQAQQHKGAAPASSNASSPSSTTWAVVAGISNYQSAEIPRLKYAHRDAEVFAKYLQSPAGGSLDNEHLIVLLNESASGAQVASALFSLIKQAKEGDQVIIYFSGHGDVENNLFDQPGYLLCWDSPPNVYMSGGTLELENLKRVIKTLTLQNKARVLVITDACRAGKLAGSANNGPQVTANNLKAQFSNEVKILSCQPDQLSQEGSDWGGGRGVFSYYLMQGIEGKADRDGDGTIDLQEIDLYLYDRVRAATQRSQIPVTVGDKSAMIAKVPPHPVLAVEQNSNPTSTPVVFNSNTKSIADENVFSNDPFLRRQCDAFIQALQERRLLCPEQNCAFALFENLKDRPEIAPFLEHMRHDFATALESETQQAINDYLKSDPVELQRRWSNSEQYEQFPKYLAIAADLMGENYPFRNNLLARFHYFTGLNYRLRGERSQTPALYKLALAEQQKCITLETNAAYAYNEIGLLKRRTKQIKESIEYFEKSISYSPGWVLPWANLCGSYFELEDYTRAQIAGEKATMLANNFALAHYNIARVYEKMYDYAKAEKEYQLTIQFDPEYTNAYSQLGYVYFSQKKYLEAESMWLEYAKRDSLDIYDLTNLGEVSTILGKNDIALKYFQKALKINPSDYPTYHSLGQLYLKQGNLSEAAANFQRYVELQPVSPVGYYFLAQIAHLNNQPESVRENLKLASERDKDFLILRESSDLESLRKDVRFGEMMRRELPDWKQ